MNITQLVETTETVTIERGAIQIAFECYLERINAENEEYDAMLREARELEAKQRMAAAELALFLTEGWIERQVILPAEGDEALPTDSDVKKRTQELQKRLKQIENDKRASDKFILNNKLKRILYLAKSWDITHGDPEMPMPLTDENLRRLSPVIINQTIEQIEEAVFGPLAMR